jgi:3-phosphoinositide dependent protein kinase-1
VRCRHSFDLYIDFALELAPGGEMFSYLAKYGPFSFEAAQFYTAELVNGLEYMHGLGIVHRDMKPEVCSMNS